MLKKAKDREAAAAVVTPSKPVEISKDVLIAAVKQFADKGEDGKFTLNISSLEVDDSQDVVMEDAKPPAKDAGKQFGRKGNKAAQMGDKKDT